jgi:hypothetical protein
MAQLLPQPGQVIRYAYLWWSEARVGREDGANDRPCGVIYGYVTLPGLDPDRNATQDRVDVGSDSVSSPLIRTTKQISPTVGGWLRRKPDHKDKYPVLYFGIIGEGRMAEKVTQFLRTETKPREENVRSWEYVKLQSADVERILSIVDRPNLSGREQRCLLQSNQMLLLRLC